MSGATTASVTPRISGVLARLDRLFPLAWIGFYLLLPVSGWAPIMFRSWADQVRDLAALRSLIETGHAAAIDSNAIGPAYIWVAALLHSILRVSPEDALVILARSSYALSVALAMLLIGALVRRWIEAPPLVSVGAQFVLAATVFAAGTWHWSDVPWSHFFAAFLAVSIYATRYASGRIRTGHAALIGLLLAFLYLARSFEFAAIVLAWGLGWLVVALTFRSLKRPSLMHVAAGAGTFLASLLVVYGATGKRGLFLLYGHHLDEQRATVGGHVVSAPVASLPTFSPGYVPVKLVQLFVEPCYYAMCSVADYAGGAVPLPSDLAGAAGNELLWRLPLAVQLPSLTLLPLCVLAIAFAVVWAGRHRVTMAGRARELQCLVEMTIAASGLVVGYAASTMTGSSHLRYGLARDFLLPALLVAIVAVTLISAALWRVLSRHRFALAPESTFVLAAVAGSAVLVLGAAYARAHGIPRLAGKQLGAVTYRATCQGELCKVSIHARTTGGQPISIPDSSTLSFGCGSSEERFTIYAASLDRPVRLTQRCPKPRLVGAWPTVAGLPPGSYELHKAVTVVNA